MQWQRLLRLRRLLGGMLLQLWLLLLLLLLQLMGLQEVKRLLTIYILLGKLPLLLQWMLLQ